MTSPTVAVPHYSQSDEQEIILDFFAKNPPKFGCRLLDIGAWTGKELSNTRALIEQGWDGVLVEAAAGPFVSLMGNCRGFPKARLVHSFVVGSKSILHGSRLLAFHHTQDAVSTADIAVYEAWKPAIKDYYSHMMPATRVAELLDAFPGPFDLVSLDTEGETFSIFCDVLEMVNTSLLVVEHAVGGVSVADQMRGLAGAKGYREIACNGENLIFAGP